MGRASGLEKLLAKLFTTDNQLILHVMVLLFIVSLCSTVSHTERKKKKESGLVFFIIGWGFFRFFWIGLFFLLGEVWGFLSVEKLTRLKVEKHLNTFFAVNSSFQVLSVLGGKSSILTWLRHAMLKSYSCRQNYEQ